MAITILPGHPGPWDAKPQPVEQPPAAPVEAPVAPNFGQAPAPVMEQLPAPAMPAPAMPAAAMPDSAMPVPQMIPAPQSFPSPQTIPAPQAQMPPPPQAGPVEGSMDSIFGDHPPLLPGDVAVDEPKDPRQVNGKLLAVLALVVVIVGAAAWYFLHKSSSTVPSGPVAPVAAQSNHPSTPPTHAKAPAGKPSKVPASSKKPAATKKSPAAKKSPASKKTGSTKKSSAAAPLTAAAMTSFSSAAFAVLPAQLSGWTSSGSLGTTHNSGKSTFDKRVKRCGLKVAPTTTMNSPSYSLTPFIGQGSVDFFASAANAAKTESVLAKPSFVNCAGAALKQQINHSTATLGQVSDMKITSVPVKGLAHAAAIQFDFQVASANGYVPARLTQVSAAVGSADIDYTAVGVSQAKTLAVDVAVLKAMVAAAH